jgi:hypothetical protein
VARGGRQWPEGSRGEVGASAGSRGQQEAVARGGRQHLAGSRDGMVVAADGWRAAEMAQGCLLGPESGRRGWQWWLVAAADDWVGLFSCDQLECTFGVHDCVLLNCWRVQDCTPSETPEKFE